MLCKYLSISAYGIEGKEMNHLDMNLKTKIRKTFNLPVSSTCNKITLLIASYTQEIMSRNKVERI